ncbi:MULTISPECIES: hypothetical protein [unclassified Saccharicrinis]|uniref:hypothetical protein n=1 Tax=unclassified Saccharicrinis TaxID=2646859 RepID=UPI003D326F48
MNVIKTLFATLVLVLLGLCACDKSENNDSPELIGTIWVCDTIYSGLKYYYQITFKSKNEFDYYEDGFIELNEKGTYRYNPPKIDMTIWGITIEGSIEENKLYYPTLATDDVDAVMRVFTEQ